MNEFETRINEEPPFKVRGHDVVIMSPTAARVTIHCPWPAAHLGQAPTEEQRVFVMNHTQSVVNYMLAEGLMQSGGNGVGIIVETQHTPLT